MKPLADRVVVKATPEDRIRDSGLVIPDVAVDKPQLGVVLFVGEGHTTRKGVRIPPEVAEGDTVIFSKFGGTEVTVVDEDILILRESDIFAKVA